MEQHNASRSLLGILLAGLIFPALAMTPKHGWLKAEGGNLLNDKGNIVQLRGMSFYWSNPSWNGIKYYTAGTVSTMVNDWKCTVLRVAYDRDQCHDNGWSQCQTVIKAAIDAGIYVIIDWHSYDAHTCQSAAVSFFTTQAQNYKSTPNVIFEPYNEPITAGGAAGGTQEDALKTWAAIKPYLTAVTQAIRDQGANNLIILGTPYYSQFVNVAANDQIKDKNGDYFKNVAYAFHFYAASHGPNAHYLEQGKSGMEGQYLQGGLGKVPIFISEWGTSHSNGGAEGKTYVDAENTEWWFSTYVDKYHVSHCNWSISDFEASSCFSGSGLSQSGQIVQKHIKNNSTDEYLPVSEIGNEGPAKDSVFSMPGYHPAKSFNQYYGGTISATDFAVPYGDRDNVDVQNAAHTCVKISGNASGDWVSYYLNISSATKKLAVRWLAKDGNGSVDVLLNRTQMGSFTIQKDSAWVTSVIDMDAPAGNDTLTFKFQSNASGYFIEWFRLAANIALTFPLPAKGAIFPVSIAPASRGFDVFMPVPHGFEAYRIIGLDGKSISGGAIGREQSRLRFAHLPCGIWFLELLGTEGRKLFPAMAQ